MRSETLLLITLSTLACNAPSPAAIQPAPDLRSAPTAAPTPSPAPAPAPDAPPPAPGPCFEKSMPAALHIGRWITHAAWAPTGDRLAVTCDESIEVIEIPSRRLVGRQPPGATVAHFRRDGAALLLQTALGLRIWDLASDALVPLAVAPPAPAASWLSGSFGRLAVHSPGGPVAIVDVATGSTLATLGKGRSFGEIQVSWSPDEARLITEGEVVELWDATSGDLLRSTKPPSGEAVRRDDFMPVQWSPDGSTVLFGTSPTQATGYHVHAWNTRTGKLRGAWTAESFAFAADGGALFLGTGSTLVRVDLHTGRTRNLVHLSEPGAPYVFHGLSVSADGRWLTANMQMMTGVSFYAIDTSNGTRAPWADRSSGDAPP